MPGAILMGVTGRVCSLKPTDVPLRSQLLALFGVLRVYLIKVMKIHTFESLASLQSFKVFAGCICHSECYKTFSFCDICYIQETEIVSLGVNLSVAAAQAALLVSAHTFFLRLHLQDYWDMYCVVGFISDPSYSVDLMGISVFVCVCPSNKGAKTVVPHHRNSHGQMLTTYIVYAWKDST